MAGKELIKSLEEEDKKKQVGVLPKEKGEAIPPSIIQTGPSAWATNPAYTAHTEAMNKPPSDLRGIMASLYGETPMAQYLSRLQQANVAIPDLRLPSLPPMGSLNFSSPQSAISSLENVLAYKMAMRQQNMAAENMYKMSAAYANLFGQAPQQLGTGYQSTTAGIGALTGAAASHSPNVTTMVADFMKRIEEILKKQEDERKAAEAAKKPKTATTTED